MRNSRRIWIAGIAFAVGFGSAVLGDTGPAQAARFDHTVRSDFFAGFAGNAEAFERAMKIASEAIAANPDHAEALVWHGAGLYFRAGRAFQSGDGAKGLELYRQGFAEMDRAVNLAPKSIGVRIPRGASLLAATAAQPMDERVRGEVLRAVEDYRTAFDLQKEGLDKLGEHSLGQLLLGLGDGYSRLGETDKARVFFEMMESKLPGTEYAKRAAAWKKTGTLSIEQRRCIGCHTAK